MNHDGTFGRAPLKAEFAQIRNTDHSASDETHTANLEAESPQRNVSPSVQDIGTNNAALIIEEQTVQHGILFPDSQVFPNFIEWNAPTIQSLMIKKGLEKLSRKHATTLNKASRRCSMQLSQTQFNKDSSRKEEKGVRS